MEQFSSKHDKIKNEVIEQWVIKYQMKITNMN